MKLRLIATKDTHLLSKSSLSNSLFTRTYLIIILSLTVTGAAFVSLGGSVFFSTGAQDFYNDAKFFWHRYLQAPSETDFLRLRQQLDQKKKVTFYIFDLEIVAKKDFETACVKCDLIEKIDGTPVYVKDDGVYVTVFAIPSTDRILIFSENMDFFSSERVWYEDSEVVFVLALFSLLSVSLAIVLYVQIRMLDLYLKDLLNAYKNFGDGNVNLRANDKVPYPISSLASGFNQMADEIEGKIRQSLFFSQAISHELRTPLARVQLSCDLARIDIPQNKQDKFDEIDSYIEEINNLIHNLVTLSKLTPSENRRNLFTESEFDFVDFLKERLSSLHNVHTDFNTDRVCSDIICEQTLAKLVVDNIISNAERYAKTAVVVSLFHRPEHMVVIIDDDGTGIPHDKRREVFLAFSRLDESRSSSSGGYGLGLSLASHAARNLEWEIVVSDSPLGGARFSVVIPNKKPDIR